MTALLGMRSISAVSRDIAPRKKIREGSTSESRTTVDLDGHFHTRPVHTLQLEGVDTLWFFTDRE